MLPRMHPMAPDKCFIPLPPGLQGQGYYGFHLYQNSNSPSWREKFLRLLENRDTVKDYVSVLLAAGLIDSENPELGEYHFRTDWFSKHPKDHTRNFSPWFPKESDLETYLRTQMIEIVRHLQQIDPDGSHDGRINAFWFIEPQTEYVRQDWTGVGNVPHGEPYRIIVVRVTPMPVKPVHHTVISGDTEEKEEVISSGNQE